MVEYGQQSTVTLLEKVVRALSRASIDDQHFLHGFAGLLSRLGKHWRSGQPHSDSPSVLNPAMTARASMSPRSPLATNALTPSIEALFANAAQAPDAGTGPSMDPAAGLNAMAQDFTWNFDPTFQMPAADHEHDMLFESIWGQGQEVASGSASNLYATLLGDALAFPEGLDGS